MMYLIVASLRSSHRSCTVLRTRVAAVTDASAPCIAFPLALRPLRPAVICANAPGEPSEPGGGLAWRVGLVPRGVGVCNPRLRQSAEVSFENRRQNVGDRKHLHRVTKKGAHLAGRRHPCVLLPERADRRMAEPSSVNLTQQRRDQRRVRATRTQSLLHSVSQAGPGRVDPRRLGLQNRAAGCRARGGGDRRGGRGCDRHTLDHR